MKYKKVVKGSFVDRPNRFIAHVKIDDEIQTVHVKNTGRAGNCCFRMRKFIWKWQTIRHERQIMI